MAARIHSTLLALLLVATSACAAPARTGDRGTVVAFVNVAVVPMDSERVLRGQTVVVRDGRIATLGATAAVRVPRGARRIDGTGRYLLPGLIDAHVHLRDRSELLSYLAWGVTTVFHLSGATGSIDDVLDLRSRVASGEIPGPSIYTTGRILDGDPPIYPGVSVAVPRAADAAREAAAQVAAGADFVKVYNNLPEPALRAAIAAAHQRGVAVFGHIPRAGGRATALQAALAARLDVIAHGEEFFFTYFHEGIEDQLSQGGIPEVALEHITEAVRMTREAGAAVIPNLSFIAATRAQLDDLGAVHAGTEWRFLTEAVREAWRRDNPTTRRDLERFDRRERAKYPFVQKLTRALSDAGVPLLLGTDASAAGLFPGRSAHLELQELVQAGLTPYQALATGTKNAGAFLAAHTRGIPAGTITPGSRADLLLLRGNPLEDVTHAAAIEGVMVRGKWHSAAELQQSRDGPGFRAVARTRHLRRCIGGVALAPETRELPGHQCRAASRAGIVAAALSTTVSGRR